MSTGTAQVVREREATFTPGPEDHKSPQQLQIERREAQEKIREEREKPRKDFLLGKGGKASDYFEGTTNREVLERYTDQTGAPKPFEEFTDSEREKFLRDGELLPAKKPADEQKPATPEQPKLRDFVKQTAGGDFEVDQAGYEAAIKKWQQAVDEGKQQAAKQDGAQKIDARLDAEIFKEISQRRDWWNEPEHANAHQTFPQRLAAAKEAMSADDKNLLATSPAMSMPISDELQSFLGHALSRVKNLGHVYLELAKDPGMVKRMNEDWVKSANNHRLRYSTEQSIRYVLKVIDKSVGSTGNGASGSANRAERQTRRLTQAGRPPAEAAGGSSTPEDEAEAAVKRGDSDRYQEIMNERDRERWRAKHGRRRR